MSMSCHAIGEKAHGQLTRVGSAENTISKWRTDDDLLCRMGNWCNGLENELFLSFLKAWRIKVCWLTEKRTVNRRQSNHSTSNETEKHCTRVYCVHCDAEMSKKAFFAKKYDASTEQQERGRRRNLCGRRFGSQTQGRSRTFQLNVKMMNKKSKDFALSRGSKSTAICRSSSHSEIRINCTQESTSSESGAHNSAVRDILLLLLSKGNFITVL